MNGQACVPKESELKRHVSCLSKMANVRGNECCIVRFPKPVNLLGINSLGGFFKCLDFRQKVLSVDYLHRTSLAVAIESVTVPYLSIKLNYISAKLGVLMFGNEVFQTITPPKPCFLLSVEK